MKVGIHQPNFLPHLGYFEKIRKADVFVFLDDVQYSKQGYTNRVKLNSKWVTFPCKKGNLISEIEISNPKHNLMKIFKRFKQECPLGSKFYEKTFARDHNMLVDFNLETILLGMEYFGIETTLYCTSQMKIAGNSNQLLVNICKELGAKTYITRKSSYLDPQLFIDNGISLEYFNSMQNSDGESILKHIT